MSQLLTNYYALRDRIDQKAAEVTHHLGEHMACRAGCDGCCRHLEIFPVEAYALQLAAQKLSVSQRQAICHDDFQATDGPCPLLQGHLCALYADRPLICRTHGLPLMLTTEAGSQQLDYCPLNFQQLQQLPGEQILSIETVNQTLAAINRLFVQQSQHPWPERLSIFDAICGQTFAP